MQLKVNVWHGRLMFVNVHLFAQSWWIHIGADVMFVSAFAALTDYLIDIQVKGSMIVSTKRKTMDPYNIVKSMDFIKLLSRSVLAPSAIALNNDKWSSAYDVRSILISIQSLLGAKHKLASEHACSSALE
ncbi:hypothetical protein QVD17_28653 [Tagetes erecta]|uniref:KRR-R motif-containing protein 1 n=1 Tax=Tagetes erecta TaxID=13708 RepID=A0AAD8KDS1_TARER|nr:hypothetical protein QVD17_28652 [Tagetes erecta]KAK1419481.1 hypothetical protein QVD17_28653 [Tagetes erecta]